MKIYTTNTLAELCEIRDILAFISGELQAGYNYKDLQKVSDIYLLEQIITRTRQRISNHAHRPRTAKVKHWITLPELSTLSRAVTVYYLRLCPASRAVIRELYFNKIFQQYHNIHRLTPTT